MTKTPDGRPVIFFDLDNVLLDTDRFKKDLFSEADSKLGHGWMEFVYQQIKKSHRVVGYATLWKALEGNGASKDAVNKVKEWCDELDMVEYLQEGVEDLIKHLKVDFNVKIFSEGNYDWQMRKIRKSGLLHLITDGDNNKVETNILIAEDKIIAIPTLTEVAVMVDDKYEVLEKFRECHPEAIGVFMNFDSYARLNNKQNEFQMVDNLQELGDFLGRLEIREGKLKREDSRSNCERFS